MIGMTAYWRELHEAHVGQWMDVDELEAKGVSHVSPRGLDVRHA
jgi:hypothetical protein